MEAGGDHSRLAARRALAFGLAGAALALRLASDWLFREGGPLTYQLAQALLLAAGLLVLAPAHEVVFLRGGEFRRSVQLGLVAAPLGLAAGLGDALMELGGPRWPSPAAAVLPIANNLFFSAIEELEFRGFLLAWLLARRVRPALALVIVAALATLAHVHRLWAGDVRAVAFTAGLAAWWTWIALRTRSLWGAWVAHALWNVFVLLPELGLGRNLR